MKLSRRLYRIRGTNLENFKIYEEKGFYYYFGLVYGDRRDICAGYHRKGSD